MSYFCDKYKNSFGMKSKNELKTLYDKYYKSRSFEQEDVFRAIQDKYTISSALYPGSFIHITPSFTFTKVVYVDNNGEAKKFFSNKILVKEMIDSRKSYNEESGFEFIGQDYNKPLSIEEQSFDLLISHYAGIISQPCKKYLKRGGILLVNNSHADAGIAYLDEDFNLIATIDYNRKKLISEKNLDAFFIPKKEQKSIKETLIRTQKGIGYTNTANLYVFKKIK